MSAATQVTIVVTGALLVTAVFLWHVRAGRREVLFAVVAGVLIALAAYLLVFLLLWRLVVRS